MECRVVWWLSGQRCHLTLRNNSVWIQQAVMWSKGFLQVPAWVFPPQSKDMQVRWTGNSEFPASRLSISMCQPYGILATCPSCTRPSGQGQYPAPCIPAPEKQEYIMDGLRGISWVHSVLGSELRLRSDHILPELDLKVKECCDTKYIISIHFNHIW